MPARWASEEYHVAGFEDLIRKAIANHTDVGGGAAGPEQRAAIYDSSRAALERMLAQNGSLDDSAVQVQRDRLNAAIETIEADHRSLQAEAVPQRQSAPHPLPPSMSRPERLQPDVPSVSVNADQPRPPAAPEGPAAGQVRPELAPNPAMQQPVEPPSIAVNPEQVRSASHDDLGFSARRDPAPGSAPIDTHADAFVTPVAERPVAPQSDGFSAEPRDVPPDYDGRALRKRRPYAKMLAWVIILTGLGVAAWWLYSFGTGLLNERADGSVPNPQQVTELGPFRPDANDGSGEADGEGPWLTVFDPARDAGNIVTGDRGTAELVTQDGRQVALLTSSDNTENGTILIRIPRGVATEIAGKAATFEVVARGADGSGQQIGIFCEFDALGTCGRKRFEVDEGQVSHIFDVLTENADLPAGREAYLGFSTDLTDGTRGLEISGIRVRAGS